MPKPDRQVPKARDSKARDYRTDVIRRLPEQKINRIDERLPENWKLPTSASG